MADPEVSGVSQPTFVDPAEQLRLQNAARQTAGTPGEDDKPPGDDETAALVQKGVYKEKGAYGDQQLQSAFQAFSGAVNAAFSLINIARSLETKTSNQPRNKDNNYYLTNEEKSLLIRRATEFAVPGIVPFDVLKDFLYVLCAVDNYDTLKYVAGVIQVSQLDNPGYVREPSLILNAENLGKIGYIANGLAALTKQIDSSTFPQVTSLSGGESSAYSALQKVAAATDVAGQILSQFPGVDIFGSVLSQVSSLGTAVQGMTSSFSSDGTTQTKISSLTSVATELSSLTESMQKSLDTAKQQNVTSLFPLADKMKGFMKNAQPIIKATEMMKNVTSNNSYPKNKVDDLNVQLKSVFDGATKLVTSFSEIQSLLSAVKSPGSIGQSASSLLSLNSGKTTSPNVTELALGQKVPPNVLANNPTMVAASPAGRAFFGESLVPMSASDQMFNRKIGVFPQPSSGAGLGSFQMQNLASLGGAVSMESLVMQLVYGIQAVEQGSLLATLITQQVSSICGVLGSSITTAIEPRRSDNAIPTMIAISTVLSNDTGCPFPTRIFSDGWKVASSLGNDLQNSNPEFLRKYQQDSQSTTT